MSPPLWPASHHPQKARLRLNIPLPALPPSRYRHHLAADCPFKFSKQGVISRVVAGVASVELI